MDEAILARQDEAVLGDGGYITKIGPGGAIEQVLSDPPVEMLTHNSFGRPLESMIDTTR